MDLLEFANKTIDSEELLGPVNRVTQELTVIADNLAIVESFSHVWAVATGEGHIPTRPLPEDQRLQRCHQRTAVRAEPPHGHRR